MGNSLKNASRKFMRFTAIPLALGLGLLSVGNAAASGLVWSASSRIDTGAKASSAPRIAVSPSGTVMAVWVQSDTVTSRIWASRGVSGVWSTPEMLTTGPMPSDAPQIAADPSGNFIAVWRQAWKTVNGANYGIYSSRYITGTGWGSVSTVYVDSNSSVTGNGDPMIASDPDGNAIAVWSVYDWSWNHNSVRANHYVAGTGWSGVTNLSTEAVQSASGGNVAIDASGNGMVVWSQTSGTDKGVRAVRYTAGTGWGTPVLIESAIVAADRSGSGCQIAFDPAGNAMTVWYQYSKPGIYARRYVAGTGWDSLVTIPDTGTTSYDEGVQLAVDKNGNALAVWNQYGGKLYSNRYTAGSGWGITTVMDLGYPDYSEKVVFEPNGNAVAVWGQYTRNSYNIFSNKYWVGKGWGSVSWDSSMVNKSPDYTGDPQLVIDNAGRATAVWVQWSRVYSAIADSLSLTTGVPARHASALSSATIGVEGSVIRLSVAGSAAQNVSIGLYTISGRFVTLLAAGKMNPGTYRFDLRNKTAAGCCVIKITTGNSSKMYRVAGYTSSVLVG